MAVLNGTPMGPGFFIFFNNLDISSPVIITPSEGIKAKREDIEVLELLTIILNSRILNG